MNAEKRVRYKIDELQDQWSLLSEVLSRVAKGKILETDPAVKFKFERKISELETEREQVEQQLDKLEAQLVQNWEKTLEISLADGKTLRDLQISFNSFIVDRTREFIGRDFVFKEINAFLNNKYENSGYFIIRGEPGIGKSAIIAHLVEDENSNYIYHFNIRVQSINDPQYFLANVYAQVVSQLKLNHSKWPPDKNEEGKFLNQLLIEASNKLKGNDKLVLVVDALDEVDLSQIPTRTNVLYLPQELPQNVFIIATVRDKYYIPLQVTNVKELPLKADSDDNIKDARGYIQSQFSNEQDPRLKDRLLDLDVTQEDFIETVLEKSKGNFMYLHHVLRDIKMGSFIPRSIDELPIGLRNYYHDHWEQMRNKDPEVFDKLYKPVICVLAAEREALSLDLIASYTQLNHDKVYDVIKKWFEFLHKERDENRQRLYRVYHPSFQEFLSEEVDPGLRVYHAMIARHNLRLVRQITT